MSQPMARAYIFDLLGDYARVGGDEIKLKALVSSGREARHLPADDESHGCTHA